MNRVLVTGGAGYIGSHVVKRLIESGYKDISIVDNLTTGSKKRIETLKEIAIEYDTKIEFYNTDLGDFDKVKEILANGYSIVLHFAASIEVPESVRDPLKYYKNNTLNSINLIDLANRSGIKRFIFSSTAAVYGEPKSVPVDENTTTDPINPYGMSKLMSERVLIDTARVSAGFSAVILRYFNVAGADMNGARTLDEINPRIGQSYPNATHLIKIAAQTALGKRDFMYIFGEDYNTPDGTCIRDYIHIDDLADAHIKAIGYECEDSEVFNVGYGHGLSVKEVIDTMKKVSGVDFMVKKAPKRAGDPAVLISNNSKIVSKMGWNPKYDNIEFLCKSALEWEKRL